CAIADTHQLVGLFKLGLEPRVKDVRARARLAILSAARIDIHDDAFVGSLYGQGRACDRQPDALVALEVCLVVFAVGDDLWRRDDRRRLGCGRSWYQQLQEVGVLLVQRAAAGWKLSPGASPR